MIIFLHIIIAVASLLIGAAGLVRPSRALLHMSYSLITLTIMSGTLVVLTAGASVPRACLSGLGYLAVMAVLTLLVRRKLALASLHTGR